jgi:hypothetical protein
MQKHVNAKIYLLSLFLCRQYGVHGALKNAKGKEYFYDDFFQCRYRNANLNMQCRI